MSTFGNTSTGSLTDYAADPNALLSGKYTLSEAGSVSKVTCYMGMSYPGDFKGVIYVADGADGIPGTFKGATPGVEAPAGTGWVDFEFSSPVSLAAGDYWIGVIANAYSWQGVLLATASSGGDSGYGYDSYASPGDFSNTWWDAAFTICAYATYTTGEPPAAALHNLTMMGAGTA